MKCHSCKKEMKRSVMFLCENNCVENCCYEGDYELHTHIRNKPIEPCDRCRGSIDSFLVYDCAECDVTIYSTGKRHRRKKLTTFYSRGCLIPTFNPEHPFNHEKGCPCDNCQEMRWINNGIPKEKGYTSKFKIKLDFNWHYHNINSYIHRIVNKDKLPSSVINN